MRGFRLLGILVVTGLLLGPLGTGFEAGSAENDLADRVARLAGAYQAQMAVADPSRELGLALGLAGETWAEAGLKLADRFRNGQARDFIGVARSKYQRDTAASQEARNLQLSGLNFLYQSLNVLAFVLARQNGETRTLESIKDTERRIMAVVGRSGPGGPALAALSGGVLTMLAVVARQLDREGRMSQVLDDQLQLRREVDVNISERPDLAAETRILLLTNNHLHGAISMAQIAGLVQDPGLKTGLGRIEEALLKTREADLEDQILAGAKALAETGFLVAPTLVSVGVNP
ncbi:MAG: hypothetical protein KKB20_08940 [Proteobacteria bacterium]|nr:hypothetical protein [Pseudomonadota bacterium]